MSVKVLENMVDLFDVEYRDHESKYILLTFIDYDISNCVVHVMDVASKLHEIELNEEEAPFLRGQTTKAGMCLTAIRISNDPDGHLQQAAQR